MSFDSKKTILLEKKYLYVRASLGFQLEGTSTEVIPTNNGFYRFYVDNLSKALGNSYVNIIYDSNDLALQSFCSDLYMDELMSSDSSAIEDVVLELQNNTKKIEEFENGVSSALEANHQDNVAITAKLEGFESGVSAGMASNHQDNVALHTLVDSFYKPVKKYAGSGFSGLLNNPYGAFFLNIDIPPVSRYSLFCFDDITLVDSGFSKGFYSCVSKFDVEFYCNFYRKLPFDLSSTYYSSSKYVDLTGVYRFSSDSSGVSHNFKTYTNPLAQCNSSYDSLIKTFTFWFNLENLNKILFYGGSKKFKTIVNSDGMSIRFYSPVVGYSCSALVECDIDVTSSQFYYIIFDTPLSTDFLNFFDYVFVTDKGKSVSSGLEFGVSGSLKQSTSRVTLPEGSTRLLAVYPIAKSN